MAVCTASKRGLVYRKQEWMLDCSVTSLKCLGGASGSEGFLIACGDGQVLSAFIDNPFPIPLWTHPDQKPILFASISSHKRTLAAVDRDHQLSVVNLESGQVWLLAFSATTTCSVTLINIVFTLHCSRV